jgi:hypothetical protein
MKKLFILSISALSLLLISCGGETCYTCKSSGEKYANGAWKTMPNEVSLCQGEDESDEDFEARIKDYRSRGYGCLEK